MSTFAEAHLAHGHLKRHVLFGLKNSYTPSPQRNFTLAELELLLFSYLPGASHLVPWLLYAIPFASLFCPTSQLCDDTTHFPAADAGRSRCQSSRGCEKWRERLNGWGSSSQSPAVLPSRSWGQDRPR